MMGWLLATIPQGIKGNSLKLQNRKVVGVINRKITQIKVNKIEVNKRSVLVWRMDLMSWLGRVTTLSSVTN